MITGEKRKRQWMGRQKNMGVDGERRKGETISRSEKELSRKQKMCKRRKVTVREEEPEDCRRQDLDAGLKGRCCSPVRLHIVSIQCE